MELLEPLALSRRLKCTVRSHTFDNDSLPWPVKNTDIHARMRAAAPMNANVVLEPLGGPGPQLHGTQLKMSRFTWGLPVPCFEFWKSKNFSISTLFPQMWTRERGGWVYKSFRIIQFSQKNANIFFILVIAKNELTDLWRS